jgi:hypothetical protein
MPEFIKDGRNAESRHMHDDCLHSPNCRDQFNNQQIHPALIYLLERFEGASWMSLPYLQRNQPPSTKLDLLPAELIPRLICSKLRVYFFFFLMIAAHKIDLHAVN